MTINWQKEVEQRKNDLFKDLFDLLKIESVRNDEQATEDAPMGPGPKKALEAFLAIGERDGFMTKEIDHLAGHIEYGSGKELLGVFGHVDVVPVGDGWTNDPFEPILRDNRIYARGSSDDKGPMMAAYYALKMIKELNLPVSKRIRLIIGTDEESSWQCMDRYLAVEETPDLGFSPDAEFPIINGEKGNATFRLVFNGKDDSSNTLVSFTSGLRPNMVPDIAEATVQLTSTDGVDAAYQAFLAEQGVTGNISCQEQQVIFSLNGKAAHGAMPEKGMNAATYLATFLDTLELTGDGKLYVQTIAQLIHNSTDGRKLNVAYQDEIMGALSMNAGVFSYQAGSQDNDIVLNFRYPKGVTESSLEEVISQTVANQDIQVELLPGGKGPHYVSPEDPLVKTLLEVYEEHTGLKGHEQVIGGGTFGRLLKRGVAYGAMFPDSIDTMHQVDEFIAVTDLLRATAIYADAIYRLASESI